MPDQRIAHTLYGSRGPVSQLANQMPRDRPMTTQLRWSGQPTESIQAHIEQAVSRIKGLGPAQRRAVQAAMLAMTRDISFIKMVMDQTPGWSRPSDEGRLL